MVALNIRIAQDCQGRSGFPRIAMEDQDFAGLHLLCKCKILGWFFLVFCYLTLSKRRVTDVNFECLEIVCFGDKQCLERCKSRGNPWSWAWWSQQRLGTWVTSGPGGVIPTAVPWEWPTELDAFTTDRQRQRQLCTPSGGGPYTLGNPWWCCLITTSTEGEYN